MEEDPREKFYKQMEPAYAMAKRDSTISIIKKYGLVIFVVLLIILNSLGSNKSTCNSNEPSSEQDSHCHAENYSYPGED
ncbi:hypothetical protein FLL45_20895 [Aliikangiella marina]|uniref:Uncharacterized protein n=1 Tax=Aliikangiella marina TaxID=1712262 RepID=A0A545T324_9GAMM|nr:hypothetical protein [Aliikangiella marina]TQV71610.1 hypothetical protein FLL45_20895 [Aliikangiella marina]